MVIHNKLIRDKIPQILETTGTTYKVRTLGEEEYIHFLNQKLMEELQEYYGDGRVEELADLVEVIYAILKHKGISLAQFEEIRMEKREKRGGFEKRLFLESVEA